MEIKELCYELENLFEIDVYNIPAEVEAYVYHIVDLVMYNEKFISNEELYKNLCDEIVVYHKKIFDEFEIYEKPVKRVEYVSEYRETGETYNIKLVRKKA